MEPISKEAYDILYNIVLEDTQRLVQIEFDKIMNKKMLKIQNINKIFGRQLNSKWLPQTKGWAVSSVESVGDTYIFELVTTDGRWKGAEIQLRREPAKYDPIYKEFLYELWAWNLVNSKPEQMWCKVSQINTIEEMALRLGMILEKILPNKI